MRHKNDYRKLPFASSEKVLVERARPRRSSQRRAPGGSRSLEASLIQTMQRDILRELYNGYLTVDDIADIYNEISERYERDGADDSEDIDFRVGAELGLAPNEVRARFAWISWPELARWRYGGWPASCAACGKAIDLGATNDDYNWVPERIERRWQLLHRDCWTQYQAAPAADNAAATEDPFVDGRGGILRLAANDRLEFVCDTGRIIDISELAHLFVLDEHGAWRSVSVQRGPAGRFYCLEGGADLPVEWALSKTVRLGAHMTGRSSADFPDLML